MPVYEYRCRKCGEKFELIRNFGEKESEVKCPKCGADLVDRIYSFSGCGKSEESCGPSSG